MSNLPSAPTSTSTRKLSHAEVVEKLRYVDPLNPTDAEQGIRSRWLGMFPQTEADVLSYQDKPTGCDCRGRLVMALVKAYASDRGVLTTIMGEPVDLAVPKSLAGEIMTIPDRPEAYRKLIKDLVAQGSVYRGLTVTPGNGTLRVFFY